MLCDIIDLDNRTTGTVDLEETVFGVGVRRDILARAVNWQLSNRRAGTHKAKSRNEVSGTSKKPFRQKGTGRARQGSLKGPHQRGGGVAFGPVPRKHGHDLPKKVRRLALRTALSAKREAGELVILDKAVLDDAKTKVLARYVERLGWKSVLIVDGNEMDDAFRKAARNLPELDLLPSRGANVYDILRRDTLVLTTAAVSELVDRLR